MNAITLLAALIVSGQLGITEPQEKDRILVISSRGCGDCVRLKEQIQTKLVGNGYIKHIEFLDYHKDPDAKQYAVARDEMVTFPQIIYLDKRKRVISVAFGYWEGNTLGWWLYGLSKRPESTLGK